MSFKEYPDSEQIQAIGPSGDIVDLKADSLARLAVSSEDTVQSLRDILDELQKLTAMMAEFMGGEC